MVINSITLCTEDCKLVDTCVNAINYFGVGSSPAGYAIAWPLFVYDYSGKDCQPYGKMSSSSLQLLRVILWQMNFYVQLLLAVDQPQQHRQSIFLVQLEFNCSTTNIASFLEVPF